MFSCGELRDSIKMLPYSQGVTTAGRLFTLDALSHTTPEGFVSPSAFELRIFCLLGKCVNHYTTEPLHLKLAACVKMDVLGQTWLLTNGFESVNCSELRVNISWRFLKVSWKVIFWIPLSSFQSSLKCHSRFYSPKLSLKSRIKDDFRGMSNKSKDLRGKICSLFSVECHLDILLLFLFL